METGIVTHIRVDKGFFFIAVAGGPDVFGHARDLNGLQFDERLEQMRVKFDVIGTERGPRAKNVTAEE